MSGIKELQSDAILGNVVVMTDIFQQYCKRRSCPRGNVIIFFADFKKVAYPRRATVGENDVMRKPHLAG